MSSAVLIAFVVIFAAVLLAVGLGTMFHESRRKKQVSDILKTVAGPTVTATTKLLKDLDPPDRGRIAQLVQSLDLTRKVTAQIQQAGLDWDANRLLALTAMAAGAGLVVGFVLMPAAVPRLPASLVLAGLCGVLPYLHVVRTRAKRLAQIEEQMPEALEFLARSMRAGHAFTISLDMVGSELADPLGQELRSLFNEQNLGAPLEVALENFTNRVPLLDARFFASSVLLQRQTGGNLSEILTRLAYLIRERFRLKGQVKAASAHGRITASVLTGLPILTAAGLMMLAPEYLVGMARDPHGRLLIAGALVAQVLARVCIKKIVNIKV